jgi:DNA-binding transcriptional MerR regulator
MRVGELAQASAVSRDTLRFYEQRGLIAAQRSANETRIAELDVLRQELQHRLGQRCPLNP